MAELKYFGLTFSDDNDTLEEIKSRLNSGNVWYHSVRNLLSLLLYPDSWRLKHTDIFRRARKIAKSGY